MILTTRASTKTDGSNMGVIHCTNVLTFPHSYKQTINCSHNESICYYFKMRHFLLHVAKMFSVLEVKWTGPSDVLKARNEFIICNLRQNEFHCKSMRAADVYVCGHIGRGCCECHNCYTVWCAFYYGQAPHVE